MRHVVLAAVFLGSATLISAQESGRISGVVTDSSGAILPNAPVVITNVARNLARTYESNSAGRFLAPDLQPGTYALSVEVTGFKRFSQSGVVLRVGDNLELPVRLEVGAASETVTITGDVPLLQTNTSSLGEVIENKIITDLPLNARQPLGLVLLTPGVSPNRQMDNAAQPFNRAGNFSVSGGRGVVNEILLDGTPNTVPEGSTGAFTAVTVFPTVESTQEFKVQTNTFSAEYGRSSGGVINFVTKSGTNQLHGSLFEFLRNSVLDGNDFFNNTNNIRRASFKRNQFGGAAGGPIMIPKLYNGRDRTFFFTSWESLIERGGVVLTTSVPTALERAGDFSQTFDARGQQVIQYDPRSGGPTRTPFAGNRIPADRIDPIARRVMSLWPDPTDAGLPFTRQNNYNKQFTRPISDHRFDVRLDHALNLSHRFYGRYTLGRRTWVTPNVYGNDADPLMRTYPSDPTSAKLGYTWSINSSTLLDVKYAFNHLFFAQSPGSLGYDIRQLGFPNSVADRAQSKEFPRLIFADYAQSMGHSSNTQEGKQNSNIITASLSKNTGRHALKFGTDLRRDHANRFVISPGALSFTFTRLFTQGPNPLAASTNAGSSIASALLGNAETGRMTLATRRLTRSWYQAYYLQDDFKVSSRLTLNMGIRYDLPFPMAEQNNNLNWFDPDAPSPLRVPGFDLRGAVTFAGSGKRNPWNRNHRNFAPRFGLAYQLDKKTVLRSAYGIFYSPHPYGTSDNVGVGFTTQTPHVGTIDNIVPVGSLANPFPTGYVLPFGLGATPNPLANLGLGITYFEPNSPTPYIQQWNFQLQRQLGETMVLEAGYVGSKGTHLPDAGYTRTQLRAEQLNPSINQSVPNPFAGVITVGTLAAAQVPRRLLLSEFPQYTSVGVQFPVAASSIYHSLQLKVTKRFSKDLSLIGSYTNAKLIDDSSGTMTWLEPATQHQDGYNRRLSRAVSDQDISQRFVLTAAYSLPFGKGRTFGANWKGLTQHLLGGWQTNGIWTMQTGIPLTLTTTNTSFAANNVLRPNSNGQSAALEGDPQTRLGRFFRTDAFSQPAPFTFGNVGRTLPDVRGPGLRALDFSVFKNTDLREGMYVQFRAEAFNLTNTPEFNNPETNLQSPAFGRITSQRNRPRQVQFALRFVF